MRRLALLPLPFLLACPNAGNGTKDSGGEDDVPLEKGCILVDDEGGYAYINDAISVASAGSTIQLCAGTYEEAVVIDKGITLLGEEGVLVTAPSNDVAISITAADVTVEYVGVESTRAGIEATGVTGLTLAYVDVGETGGWGLSLSDSDATVTDTTFTGSGAGAIEVSGGTVVISDCAISGAAGFGISVTDGAEATVTGTTISGVTSSGSAGNALYVIDSTLTTDGNVIDTPAVAGIWAEDATLELTGDTITGALYGILAQPAELDATGLTITGSLYQGIFSYSPTGTLTISDTTVSVEPGTSCSENYDDWADSLVCGGILMAAGELGLSDVEVSGYENYGIVAWAYDSTAALTMSGVTISDVGRWGLYLSGVEGNVADSTVQSLREPEHDPCEYEDSIYFDRSAAILNMDSDVAFTNLTLSDNQGWGISNVEGVVTLSGSTFSSNTCASVFNFYGLFEIDQTAFTGGANYSTVWDYYGVTSVTDSTFTACTLEERNVSYREEKGVIYETVVHGYGYDIQGTETSALTVTGNTFTDGANGVYVSGGYAEIYGNTWSTYEEYVMSLYGDGSGDDTFIVTSNVIDDVGGGVISSYYADIEVEDLTVGTTRERTYTYDYYTDGVLSYTYTGTTYGTVFSTSGSTGYAASLSLTSVTVDSAYGTVLSAQDAPVDIDGLTVGAYGGSYSYGVQISGYYLDDVDAELNDVTLPDGGYYGIYASGLAALTLSDVTLGSTTYYAPLISKAFHDVSGIGLVDAATAVVLENVTITGSGDDGINLEGGTLDASGVTVSDVTGDSLATWAVSAVNIADSTFSGGQTAITVEPTETYYDSSLGQYVDVGAPTNSTLSGITIAGSARGIAQVGGSLTLSASSITGATGSGLRLEEVDADVQGNTISGNGEYGMVCIDTTLSACATNDLTQNVLGTHDGCDDACGL